VRRWLLLLCCACSSQVPAARFDVELIGPDGRSPFDEGDYAINVQIAQPGRLPIEETLDVSGDFASAVPVFDDHVETRIRVVIEGPDGQLVGAPPPFVPSASGGRLRVVVGEPGTCEELRDVELENLRLTPAVARVDTFAVVAGGRSLEGAALTSVEFIDLLRLFSGDLEDMTIGGEGSGARLGVDASLLVFGGGGVRYDLSVQESRESNVPLHAGAGPRSAVLAVGEQQVAILGGADAAEVTWVAANGNTLMSSLAGPRADATAFPLDDQVLLAGGDGPSVAELVTRSGATPIGEDDGVRRNPLLVPAGDDLWLLGGVDDEGAARTDTVVLRGCPGACTAEPGPEWPDARIGATAATDLPYVVDGERVLAIGAGPTFTELARLQHTRAGAAAIGLDSGLVLVVGGTDGATPRSDVEVCFPSELLPF